MQKALSIVRSGNVFSEKAQFELTAAEADDVRTFLTRSGLITPMWTFGLLAVGCGLNALLAWQRVVEGRAGGQGLALAILETSLLFSVVMLAGITYASRSVVARATPGPGVPSTFELADAGLVLTNAGGELRVPWRKIERVVALQSAFVFLTKSPWRLQRVYVLPRRALERGQAERVWNLIDEKLTARAGVVRSVEFVHPTIFNTLAR